MCAYGVSAANGRLDAIRRLYSFVFQLYRMARTKQTARSVKRDLYVHVRKQHLENLGAVAMRAALLLEDLQKIASKDERTYYKNATHDEHRELRTHIRSISETLDEASGSISKIAESEFPITTVSVKRPRFVFASPDPEDENPRPTKRTRTKREIK